MHGPSMFDSKPPQISLLCLHRQDLRAPLVSIYDKLLLPDYFVVLTHVFFTILQSDLVQSFIISSMVRSSGFFCGSLQAD